MKIGQDLFTVDSNGSTRYWRVEVEGSRFRTVSGIVGGTAVTSEWTQAVGKNPGKANETTGEEQARKEALALMQKKSDRKYHVDVNNVGSYKFTAPMLAHKYEKWNGPCYAQPKLDGIRCIASAAGLFSRQGKKFNIAHIEEVLAPLFKEYPNLILDGELYNHSLRNDFNKIASLVKKQTRSREEVAECEQLVQYHVYDIVNPRDRFRDRYASLFYISLSPLHTHPSFKTVPTIRCSTEEELDNAYAEYLEAGWEGQIIRYDELYEIGKRSKFLLKRKTFQDEEYKLISVEEGKGNWSGYAKTVTCELPDGRYFSAGVAGTQEFTAQLLEEWKQYGAATIRFFALTPDGIPRFGVATAWHKSVEERD